MRLRTMIGLTLLASGVACKSSTSPSTPAYVGTYSLTRVNGSPLPYSQTTAGVTVTLNSGTAQLLSNGTWTTSLSVTPAGLSTSSSGTYTVSGSTITFTNTADGSQSPATFSNNTITVVVGGSNAQTLVFTKN
jgi:hypothetical protein